MLAGSNQAHEERTFGARSAMPDARTLQFLTSRASAEESRILEKVPGFVSSHNCGFVICFLKRNA